MEAYRSGRFRLKCKVQCERYLAMAVDMVECFGTDHEAKYRIIRVLRGAIIEFLESHHMWDSPRPLESFVERAEYFMTFDQQGELRAKRPEAISTVAADLVLVAVRSFGI